MPSLRCLISTLTQAGGADLLFRFASSVQSCCGEGGALQADVAVCGEHSPYSDQAARSFGGLSLGAACLFPPRRAARAARGLCALSPGRGAPFPSAASGPGSQRLGALYPGVPRLFPPRPQRAPPVGSQEVFRQEPGPVCRVGGGGFSGAEFAPSPPPASYLQRGWGGSSLEFLSPFVLRNAPGVFWLVNFSLALPQLKKISLRLLSSLCFLLGAY